MLNTVVVLLVSLCTLTCVQGHVIIEKYACFNNLFDIKCNGDQEVLVFESAHYGQNDTNVASKCETRYNRNCDVDVQLQVNRLCAGKSQCAVGVNKKLFELDPCGGEEFLRVKYRCAAAAAIQHECSERNPPPSLFDHGYIVSPNYPKKYYSGADCMWTLVVQPRQKIQITIFDFELDVKKGGRCYDYLHITSSQPRYDFKECGMQGRLQIDIPANEASVRFRSNMNSLVQRGFLMYFEAIGPGCPDIDVPPHATVKYEMTNLELFANITCDRGYYFTGTELSIKRLQCLGLYWSDIEISCIALPPPTTPRPGLVTVESTSATSDLVRSGTMIGIALGVVSALLLITLLIILALYFHRRRKHAERKLDQWRVVINNLQENAINDYNAQFDTSFRKSPACNIRKVDRNAKMMKEDELQARNLLAGQGSFDDDEYDVPVCPEQDVYTPVKYPAEDFYGSRGSRRASRVGKYADKDYDTSMVWDYGDDPYVRTPRCRRNKHRRAKSGHWDPPSKGTPQVFPTDDGSLAGRRAFTQSAPDILALILNNAPSGVPSKRADFNNSVSDNRQALAPVLARSSTLGSVPHRTVKNMGSRSSSRSKIRC